MSTPSPDLSREGYRLRRAARDLYARALIGPVFYVVAWVMMLFVSPAARALGWPVVIPGVVFALFGVARFRHRPPGEDSSQAALARWVQVHWRIVTVGSACWGVVPVLVGWFERKPESAILVTALCTVAFGTAASQAFAMHPSRARLSIFLLMAPAAASFVALGELRATGVTLLIYALYLVANLRRSADEYSHQVDTELQLLHSREEVAKLSLTDDLTGLPNRRSYEVLWPQAASAAVRQQVPLALLAIDLDHFKQVNDKHGHLGGDGCLRHFATLLRQQFQRESDFHARIGGEEFIVILPGTTAAAASASAEQLRALVEATPFPFGAVNIAMTVSVGVAALDGAELDPSLTFAHADAASYAAKKAGRNRVEVWLPAVVAPPA